jgi:hypothetical protein
MGTFLPGRVLILTRKSRVTGKYTLTLVWYHMETGTPTTESDITGKRHVTPNRQKDIRP